MSTSFYDLGVPRLVLGGEGLETWPLDRARAPRRLFGRSEPSDFPGLPLLLNGVSSEYTLLATAFTASLGVLIALLTAYEYIKISTFRLINSFLYDVLCSLGGILQ